MVLDDELLWGDYANDASEALADIEAALLILEAAPARKDAIDRLYRGLHTLKGNSGFLRLIRIERLAHRAEDLIGLIRDHGVALDPPLVDLLLVVVDGLRVAVTTAGREHRDASAGPIDTLADRLTEAHAARDPARTNGAPSRSRPPTPEPALAPVSPPSITAAAAPVAAAPVEADASVALDLLEPALDAGYVEVFLSMVADAAPALATAVADAASPLTAVDARATLIGIGEDLGLAAERMGYVHVLRALAALATAARAGVGPVTADLAALELELYGALVAVDDSYRHLVDAPRDFGVATTYRRACASSALADLAALRALIERPEPTRAAVRALFGRLRAACEHHLLAIAVEGLLEQEDRVARVLERGDALTAEVRGPVLDFLGRLGGAFDDDDIAAAEATTLAPTVEPTASIDAPLSSALRAQLTAAHAADVARHTAAGARLYELHAELERRPDLATPFHAWLAATGGAPVTSAVEPAPDGVPSYRFLIASTLAPADVHAALAALDPTGRHLRAHLLGDAGAVAIAPPTTPRTTPPPTPTPSTPTPAPTPTTTWVVPPTLPVAALLADPAAAAPAADGDPEPVADRGARAEFLRIDARKVSLIMDLAGELGLASGAVTHHADLAGRDLEGWSAAAHKLEVLIRELQSEVAAMRLVPVAGVFQRMQRVVRDTGRRTGKKVELVLLGEDTEIDKVMVDALADPLVHMVRNAIDHGLESPEGRAAAGKPATGRIVLEASHQGGEVSVTVSDDGAGLDRDRILARAVERGLIAPGAVLDEQAAWNLIFAPGFSTKQVIDELSGRGVGMDIVKSTIESLRGRVQVRSSPGRGTRVTLVVPLTLAFVEAMIVGERDHLYAVPIEKVFEVFQVTAAQIATNSADGQRLLRVRDRIVPVCWLHRFYGEADHDEVLEGRIAVVVQTALGSLALPIDRLLGQEQIMLKPLGGVMAGVRAAAGCGMLRSGDVALALDCEQLHA